MSGIGAIEKFLPKIEKGGSNLRRRVAMAGYADHEISSRLSNEANIKLCHSINKGYSDEFIKINNKNLKIEFGDNFELIEKRNNTLREYSDEVAESVRTKREAREVLLKSMRNSICMRDYMTIGIAKRISEIFPIIK